MKWLIELGARRDSSLEPTDYESQIEIMSSKKIKHLSLQTQAKSGKIRNPSATRSESARTNDADPLKEIISFARLVHCLHFADMQCDVTCS